MPLEKKKEEINGDRKRKCKRHDFNLNDAKNNFEERCDFLPTSPHYRYQMAVKKEERRDRMRGNGEKEGMVEGGIE